MTKQERTLKNLVSKLLGEQGYKTYSEIFDLFDLNITDDPGVVGYMEPGKGKIVVNKGLDMSQISTIIRHEILHEYFTHEMALLRKLANDKGLDFDTLDDASLKDLKNELYSNKDFNIAGDYDISNRGYTESDKDIVRAIKLNGEILSGLVTEDEHPDWVDLPLEDMYEKIRQESSNDQGNSGQQGSDQGQQGQSGQGSGQGRSGSSARGPQIGDKGNQSYQDLEDVNRDLDDIKDTLDQQDQEQQGNQGSGGNGNNDNKQGSGQGQQGSDSKKDQQSGGNQSGQSGQEQGQGGDSGSSGSSGGGDSKDSKKDKSSKSDKQNSSSNDSLKDEVEKTKEAVKDALDKLSKGEISDEEVKDTVQKLKDTVDKIKKDTPKGDEIDKKKSEERLKQIKDILKDETKKAAAERENNVAYDKDQQVRADKRAKMFRDTPINKFKDSLNKFIKNAVSYGRNSSWSRINRSTAGTNMMKPGMSRRAKNLVPTINIYFDRSGSWNADKTAVGEQAIATLMNYDRAGKIKARVFYFNGPEGVFSHYTTEGRGDTPLEPVFNHILATKPDNVIIMTDDDFDGQHKGCENVYIDVPGAVWFLFKGGRSRFLQDHLKGKRETKAYDL